MPPLVSAAAVIPAVSPCVILGANIGSLPGRESGENGLAVTDEAIEKIKAMITSGALRAGDRLPREADLAADLGLSRSSLREAVRALSLVNILDARRGDGTDVTSLEPRLLLEALSFIVDFHRDDTPPGSSGSGASWSPPPPRWRPSGSSAEEWTACAPCSTASAWDPAAEELVANDLEFHRRDRGLLG